MIYTITFNPSIDYFQYLNERLEEGKIYRPYSSLIRAGGKGVNISIVLDAMGIESKAIMFLGGSIGELIANEIAEYKKIEVIKIPVDGQSRINVKIKNDLETALNGAGPEAGQQQIEELYEIIRSVRENDIVAISGSYCPGVTDEVIEKLGTIIKDRKARLVIDLPKLSLDEYRKIKPYLIKPNIEELADIFEEDVNIENYRSYAHRLIEEGVDNVVVSLGADGSYFCNGRERYLAKGPKIKVVNTVGSGDSLLAYVIASMWKGLDNEQCIRFGEAAGRAKTCSSELPTEEDVRKLYEKVTVERV